MANGQHMNHPQASYDRAYSQQSVGIIFKYFSYNIVTLNQTQKTLPSKVQLGCEIVSTFYSNKSSTYLSQIYAEENATFEVSLAKSISLALFTFLIRFSITFSHFPILRVQLNLLPVISGVL